MAGSGDLTKKSFEKSVQIRSDFATLGSFTESYQQENGHLPTSDQLLSWASQQQLEYFRISLPTEQSAGTGLWISEGKEACFPSEDPAIGPGSKANYTICYWRGEWTEQYAPQTGETTLPSRIEEYTQPWEYFLVLMAIAVGFGAAAYFVNTAGKRKEMDRK